MRERSSPLRESLGNDRFGKESGMAALEATPQETDQSTGIPDASLFCITGALGFRLFMR